MHPVRISRFGSTVNDDIRAIGKRLQVRSAARQVPDGPRDGAVRPVIILRVFIENRQQVLSLDQGGHSPDNPLALADSVL